MSIISRLLRYTYWINDFLKGAPIGKQYRSIKFIMENKEKGEDLRQKYLNDILKHAVSHSLYYADCNPNDFKSFPIVNKNILRENYNLVKVSESNIAHQKGKMHIQHTSGSTGTPFYIPQDTRKRNRRVAELKYFGNIVGFKSHEKMVHLRIWTRWQNKSKIQSLRENIIAFDMSDLSDGKLKKLCDIIEKKKVVCLRGYASSFDLLAKYVRDNHIILPNLSIIIAGSEALQDSTRENVIKYIKCNIISQYANEENGILAQEGVLPDFNGFYLNHASYFFELLKLDSDEPAQYGELGRIVLTDFFNYAFPIIRYDTGDTAVFTKDNDTSYECMEKLYGRRMDMVYTTEGIPIFPMVFCRILKYYDEIKQWQFIQKSKNHYELKVVSEDRKFSKESEVFSELQNYLGKEAILSFNYVNEIPVLNSGKRKSVVCELSL